MRDTFQIDAPVRGRRDLPAVRHGHGSSHAAVLRFAPRSQTVTVKGTSSASRAPHSWGRYGKAYLSRDGVGKDNEQGVGFTRAGEADLGELMKGWQASGDRAYYHVILSPERGADLDMTAYTREVMAKVEQDFGGLEWAAIAHHNTQAPHTHVVIRGEVEISDGYFNHHGRMRAYAEEIATQRLGYRLTNERIYRQERTLGREAFTETDKALWNRRDGQNRVHVADKGTTPADTAQARQERQRLAYLTEKGLATQTGEREWELHHRMKEDLKFRGANREHAPAWRKPPVQEQQVQRDEQQRVRVIDEQERGR